MKCLKDIGKGDIRKILVVKTSSLGDIIHSFPALTVLNRIFPDAEIDFLVNTQFAGLLDYAPVKIHKVVLYDRKKIGSFRYCIPSGIKLARQLRREKYDLVIDFQGLFRSSIFAFLARAVHGACGFAVPREKVLKSALLGMVAFAIIPFFGAFRFAMWQVIAASVIFGVTGAFLFGMASVCRSNKK